MPLFGPNIKKMKEKRNIEGLIKALKNKKPMVRIEATKALSELKHTQGLIKALKNDSPDVRVEAISALENVDAPDVKEALIDVLITETLEPVWQRAFEALSKIGVGDESWTHIAMELLEKQREGNAIKCFEKIMEIKPDKETIGSIGVTLIDHKLYEKALEFFEKLIEIDANDARGWEGKCIVLYNLNRDEEAVRYCKKALDIEPKLKGARDTLGALYYKKGDYEAMASLAQDTLQFAPEDIKAHVALAEALMFQDRLNEAETRLQKALEILQQQEWMKPEDLGMIHEDLGILNAMKGKKELALVNFKKAYEALRNKWDRQLQESYEILDVLGLTLRGTPQDRRGRLLGLALQRAKVKGYQSLTEKIIAETPVSEIYVFGEGIGSELDFVKAMLKFWSKEHFIEFFRIRSQREIEALIKNIEALFIDPSKERFA